MTGAARIAELVDSGCEPCISRPTIGGETAGMNYDDVYKRYYKRVSRYLSGIVGQAEAEDVAQEVFIKVGKKLASLRDQSRLSPWVFRIALNAARDKLRQRSAEKPGCGCQSSTSARDKEEDEAELVADTQSRTPEEGLARSEMIQCFIDFVKRLPRQYYDVYVLSEFEELPDKEISRKLSLPLETVKIRLHRARAKLYDELRAHCRCYHNERGELMGGRK